MPSVEEFINSILQSGQQAPQNAPNTGLQQFLNTPQYSLLYGQNTASDAINAANAGTYNPVNAFHLDPGYQFSVDQGMKQMQQNAAAKGLLESGPLLRELQQYGQGAADQNYQRWMGQQQGLFSDYQNRLSGLAQFGSTQTGAQQGVDMNNMLAQLAGNANVNTGNQLAQFGGLTAEGVASLLGNQGVLNANAMLNTGAAQANNIMQGNMFTAQLMAQQQAQANQSANSMFAGQGAMQGYQGSPMFSGGSSGGGSYSRTGTGGLPGATPTYSYF